MTSAMAMVLFAACVFAFVLSVAFAEGPVPILDMEAREVGQLLARLGITVPASASEPDHDGAALVDFIRWYESMPPIAKSIEANNPNACKAWATVAHFMDSKQQASSSSSAAFLEWCEIIKRLTAVASHASQALSQFKTG